MNTDYCIAFGFIAISFINGGRGQARTFDVAGGLIHKKFELLKTLRDKAGGEKWGSTRSEQWQI